LVGCLSKNKNKNMNNDDEDPFDCFGESDDDSSTASLSNNDNNDNDNDSSNDDSDALVEAEAERGQRLLNEHEYRKKNYEHEHVPLIQKNDFEVFDSNNDDNDDDANDANMRGKGVRVLRSYQEGEEIMREGAAIRVPGKIFTASTQEEADIIFANNIHVEFDKLSKLTADAYMDLSSCRTTENDDIDIDIDALSNNANANDTITGIYETNSFQLGDEINSGLFLTISRINHSCRPNVNHIWRPDIQKTLIQATRNIKAGEEIFTCYGPSECLSTLDRRTYLERKYSFICDCNMCQEGNDNGGDDRMIELNTIFDELSLFNVDESKSSGSGNGNGNGKDSERDKAIKSVDRGLLLLQKQGLGSGAFVRSFLRSGYQISLNATTKTTTAGAGAGATSNNNNNQDLARTYLERELIAVQNSEGIGSYRGIDIERTLKWYHGGHQ
jgi:hypothetical protein